MNGGAIVIVFTLLLSDFTVGTRITLVHSYQSLDSLRTFTAGRETLPAPKISVNLLLV